MAYRMRIHPDVIISMPEAYNVPANGSGEIKAFLVPNPFKEGTWVSSIEFLPGDPSAVHHVMLQVPDKTPTPAPGFSWDAPAPTCVPAAGSASGAIPRAYSPVRLKCSMVNTSSLQTSCCR